MTWEIALTVFGVFIVLWVIGLISVVTDEINERVPHHDNRRGSHYQVSQQALRDAREDYINGK